MASKTPECGGWTFDPVTMAWTAQVGPSRWLEVAGDLDDPPAFTPADVLAGEDPAGAGGFPEPGEPWPAGRQS